MPLRNIDRLLAASLLLLGAASAHAELADRNQPIHVDAASGEVDQKSGLRTLSGDVRIVQGTLSFFSDRATMLEQPDGSMKVTGEGRPVRFRQKVEGSADWLEGHADRIEYDNRTGDVRLLGNAWFKKGGDELNSTIVTYNTVSEKYRAEGSKTGVAGSDANAGRVHLTIIPKTAPTQGPTKP